MSEPHLQKPSAKEIIDALNRRHDARKRGFSEESFGLTQQQAPVLTPAQKKRKRKPPKEGENSFHAAVLRYQLPDVMRQFKILKAVQTPRADGKPIPSAWRFDFAWPSYKLIVEIDGGIWMVGGGAHSHPMDIERNMTKRNDASFEGYFVLSFTPNQVKKGTAIATTMKFLQARGWQSPWT